jgi:transcriptional regulator with XRE-family HTH domain
MSVLTDIANSNKLIALSDMTLGEKVRFLREVEGIVRGLGRDVTQGEVVRELGQRHGRSLSQSYLSQIESGARRHLTNPTRLLLATFFKVHPGYLVDDPEGFHNELTSDAGALESRLDLWLISGAERFRRHPEVSRALLAVARHEDSRRCLSLLGAILDVPGLAERLLQVLGPERREAAGGGRP